MLKKQAGKVVEQPPLTNGKYLEHSSYARVGKTHRTLYMSPAGKFTFSLIDALLDDLNTVLYEMDRLPEESFKALIGVLDFLSKARNELRLARFLFDVEEINAVHRLIMRNRAVLRSRNILHKALQAWPSDPP